RRARAGGADGLAPAVPGAGTRDQDHRRGHAGAARDTARGGRDPAGRGAPRRAVPRAVAVVLRAAGDPLRRRAGRFAHVRIPDRAARRHVGRRDDRGLGAASLRARRARGVTPRERDPRGQPGRARRDVEAAGDDRVGVTPPYRIETERLVIRCYEPEDAALLKNAVDSSLDHLRPWMPWVRFEPQPLDEKIDLLRMFRGQFDHDENYVYGVFDGDESRLLGGSGLHPRGGDDSLEVGYWVRADAVGQGIATEVTAVLTRAGIEHAGLKRVDIQVDPANERSLRIPRSLGFTEEATL